MSKSLFLLRLREKQLRKRIKKLKYKAYKKDERILDLVEMQERMRMRIRNREEKVVAFMHASRARVEKLKIDNIGLAAENSRLQRLLEARQVTDRLSKNKKRGSSERSQDGPSRERLCIRIRNLEETGVAFMHASRARLDKLLAENERLIATNSRLQARQDWLSKKKNKKRRSSEGSRDGPRVKKTKRESAQRRDGGERENLGKKTLSIDGN